MDFDLGASPLNDFCVARAEVGGSPPPVKLPQCDDFVSGMNGQDLEVVMEATEVGGSPPSAKIAPPTKAD